MTRTLPILTLLLLAAAAPFEPPQIIAAEHEAESFLTPCNKLGLASSDACNNDQDLFIQQYVRALSGSAEDAEGLASDFSARIRAMPGKKLYIETELVGLSADQVQSCAWRAVTLTLQNPRSTFLISLERQSLDDDCSVLSMVELLRARDRAAALIHRIADDPVRLPSSQWWMPWPDIEGFEGHP